MIQHLCSLTHSTYDQLSLNLKGCDSQHIHTYTAQPLLQLSFLTSITSARHLLRATHLEACFVFQSITINESFFDGHQTSGSSHVSTCSGS
ncbi:hypothetical protein CPB84DRAFT_1772020 [Gymnopilus junonius]|uniref:Uncharacterized protein n=1 Tax=Gymnopilus junonius TaxID=109634 RepID=A0A9P5NQ93_GYMJU|nr:hypothetical protein CPB84DRAFT_1772020 [Gymnopilus junonius]